LGQVVSQSELIRYRAGWERNRQGVVRPNEPADRYLSVVAMKRGSIFAACFASSRIKSEKISRAVESNGVRIPTVGGHSTTRLLERIKEVRS
jgi:hypothetical protein